MESFDGSTFDVRWKHGSQHILVANVAIVVEINGMINKLEDLRIWQEARVLNFEIFQKIVNKPLDDHPLKDQINRSAASIMDNIAEGFGKIGTREFIHYLSISKGSCVELKSQLYRSLDRNFISESDFNALYDKTDYIERQNSNLIKHLKSSSYKGWKFK